MSWILPTAADVPFGGEIRNVGEVGRRDYHRAYYHAKRKGRRKQTYTPEQQARRIARRAEAYRRNADRERANARARYWRNRDRYAAAARARAQARRELRRNG